MKKYVFLIAIIMIIFCVIGCAKSNEGDVEAAKKILEDAGYTVIKDSDQNSMNITNEENSKFDTLIGVSLFLGWDYECARIGDLVEYDSLYSIGINNNNTYYTYKSFKDYGIKIEAMFVPEMFENTRQIIMKYPLSTKFEDYGYVTNQNGKIEYKGGDKLEYVLILSFMGDDGHKIKEKYVNPECVDELLDEFERLKKIS